MTLVGMRLRRVPPATVVTARISAVKAGLQISIDDLEAHYLAGGNVVRVVNALISADKANIEMPFKRAAAIDLAGRDVLEAVKMSVIPKVIETARIAAVAKDGIQLIAVSRVTVRTNIDRLVGGAGEETIIARVGEGMVSTIGSAATHKDVLENPDHISKNILSRGLDAGTAYEILSIDIADVDVGENIGAKLQIDQANADKQIAQAKAEERRAMAVALEQEMRARVVEAEAEVPRAMAEAFRQGNLGIMDYYRMKNIQADSSMRESIAEGGGDEPTLPKRFSPLSDPTDDRQDHPAVVRRIGGGVDHLHAVLPVRSAGRLRLFALVRQPVGAHPASCASRRAAGCQPTVAPGGSRRRVETGRRGKSHAANPGDAHAERGPAVHPAVHNEPTAAGLVRADPAGGISLASFRAVEPCLYAGAANLSDTRRTLAGCAYAAVGLVRRVPGVRRALCSGRFPKP
jgi:uncharacterized protein YqfA (UPF0365 family)